MLLLWVFFATVRYHVIRYLPLELNSRDLIGHLGSRNSVHFTSTTVSRRVEANFATMVKVVMTPRFLCVLTYADNLSHLSSTISFRRLHQSCHWPITITQTHSRLKSDLHLRALYCA